MSTTETERIALSQALRSVIPLINLMNELIPALKIPYIKLMLRCTVFEDNKSIIAIAKVPSMLPCTKHISLKCHHVRQFVTNGLIDINYVNTVD